MADGIQDAVDSTIRAATRAIRSLEFEDPDRQGAGQEVTQALAAMQELVRFGEDGRPLPIGLQADLRSAIYEVGYDGVWMFATYSIMRFAELNAEALRAYAASELADDGGDSERGVPVE